MSLSPETLELCAKGLGVERIAAADGTGEWFYVIATRESTDALKDVVRSYHVGQLTHHCKAKLREREYLYDVYCRYHTDGCSAWIKTGTESFCGKGHQDDDHALILAFAEAVAKGALP